MPIVVQFHLHTEQGLPLRNDFSHATVGDLRTTDRRICDYMGAEVFTVVKAGRNPAKHYLWETFTIERVETSPTGFRAVGTGFVLNPPQVLDGAALDALYAACSSPTGWFDVSNVPACAQWPALAKRYFRPSIVDGETRQFCDELCATIPDDPESFVYRAQILETRGDIVGSLADLQTAAELFDQLGLGTSDDETPQESDASPPG